jgi:hypothetical protein
MAKTVSKTLNQLMPSCFDKADKVYTALIGDEWTDTGAVTNEIKEVIQFIDYYTKIQSVDTAETSLLELIVFIFSGLTRNYTEPDDYLRLRYKALIDRKGTSLWNGKASIKEVFSYFYEEKNIYLIERYPVDTLVVNGDFDSLESWSYNTQDTEFKLIYSRSFESGAALYINPNKANSAGYMEQQIPSIAIGLYELLFFFSSSKKGIGDVQFSIRDGAGRYWNGASWITGEYLFYNIADSDTAGYYQSVQKTVKIAAVTTITLRFKNKNGNGVLIDGVRFGKIEDPAFRLYILVEPELFFDGSVKADKKYNFSGFGAYYKETNMAEILQRIKPAGVYAEISLLASRLNIPWDRVLLHWETTIKTKWHVVFDGSKHFNNGTISFINLYFDGSIRGDATYHFGEQKIVISTKPTDLLFGEPLYYHTRKYKHRGTIQLTKQLYFDGSIGANGKFTFSGKIVGSKIGYSALKVTKRITRTLIGQAYFDGLWKANGELKFDGTYTYYQTGTEIYFVKEVL